MITLRVWEHGEVAEYFFMPGEREAAIAIARIKDGKGQRPFMYDENLTCLYNWRERRRLAA